MESISRQHIPVMLEPVLKLLSCRAGELYVDATLGGGGYARAILEASAPDGILLALDWDAEALVRAGKNLQEYGRRLFLKQANFADLGDVLRPQPGRVWNRSRRIHDNGLARHSRNIGSCQYDGVPAVVSRRLISGILGNLYFVSQLDNLVRAIPYQVGIQRSFGKGRGSDFNPHGESDYGADIQIKCANGI